MRATSFAMRQCISSGDFSKIDVYKRQVLNVANRSLDADLKVESVELTFFSTFPQFGLKVDEGFLVSKVSVSYTHLRQ